MGRMQMCPNTMLDPHPGPLNEYLSHIAIHCQLLHDAILTWTVVTPSILCPSSTSYSPSSISVKYRQGHNTTLFSSCSWDCELARFHHHSRKFAILIRTVFHKSSRKFAIIDERPWKTVRIYIASFREIDGIQLSNLAKNGESSWFELLQSPAICNTIQIVLQGSGQGCIDSWH